VVVIKCESRHNRNMLIRAVARRPCMRGNYLAGGGRGENTGRGRNGSALHTLRTLAIGAVTTPARKNQNGIRKAKTKPSTGCINARSKAIATHRRATHRDAKRMSFICSYLTPINRMHKCLIDLRNSVDQLPMSRDSAQTFA